jgi:hypothetical protein
MRYSARHRAHRTNAPVRAATTAAACLAMSTAFVAVPATSSALDATPYKQLVVGHVRVVSIVGTPETAAAISTAFNASAGIQPGYGTQTHDDSDGGGRVPLSRSDPSFDFADGNFKHSVRWNEPYSNLNWGTQLTPAWQGMATGPVTENTYWYVNGAAGGSSNHTGVPADYHFHGTIPGVGPGDTVDMATEITFECGEATCTGTLYASYYVEEQA